MTWCKLKFCKTRYFYITIVMAISLLVVINALKCNWLPTKIAKKHSKAVQNPYTQTSMFPFYCWFNYHIRKFRNDYHASICIKNFQRLLIRHAIYMYYMKLKLTTLLITFSKSYITPRFFIRFFLKIAYGRSNKRRKKV